MSPNYDADANGRLAARTEYEMWLLEAIYAIAEEELFPVWPDAVIYPVSQSRPLCFGYARANCVIGGDWRSGFLDVGAPLVFVATFKLLDMFVEWVLGENGFQPKFQVEEKLKQLRLSPTFPDFIEQRPWLKERLPALYGKLAPLRGTIVHDRHFTASDGAICVSASKRNVIGPLIAIEAPDLRKLALTMVSTIRYVDGSWSPEPYREKQLRRLMDDLAKLHELPCLGQQAPQFSTVRVYSTHSDPRSIGLAAIRNDLMRLYPNHDCMFDLRVITVCNGTVSDAYLFPWDIVASEADAWGKNLDTQMYRVPIPTDIDPTHLAGSAVSAPG